MNNKKNLNVKKMVMAAMLGCLSYVCSTFIYFPQMAPFQHLFNVLSAVLLGPWWGFASAALTGLMRMILGGRTIQALIGAVVGAFLSGFLYRKTKKLWMAAVGEIIGTGILSALLVYPFMVHFYGIAPETPFWFYIPFYIPSSAMGACIGLVILKMFEKTGILGQMHSLLGD